MGFERFGTVSYTAQTKVDKFVDLLNEGKVAGTRCRNCGTAFFPPRADCYGCLSSDMEWFEILGLGKLVSFSTLFYAPTGFEDDLPYAIAVVRFGDTRIFGRIGKEMKEEELKIGMDLDVAAIRLPDGKVSYEFRRPS